MQEIRLGSIIFEGSQFREVDAEAAVIGGTFSVLKEITQTYNGTVRKDKAERYVYMDQVLII